MADCSMSHSLTFSSPGHFAAYEAAVHFLCDQGFAVVGNWIVRAGTACGTLSGDPKTGPIVVRWRRSRDRPSPAKSVDVTQSRPLLPANVNRYPPRCPDPDWCRCNHVCYWDCRGHATAAPPE